MPFEYFYVFILLIGIIGIIISSLAVRSIQKENFIEPLWNLRQKLNKNLFDIVIDKQGLAQKSSKSQRPTMIFVKNDPEYIREFLYKVLPGVTGKFILLTGSSDNTLPIQEDLRAPRNSIEIQTKLKSLAKNPNLIKWYVENLDTLFSPKVIPIPLGFHSRTNEELYKALKFKKAMRQNKIICTFRLYKSNQFADRREIMNLVKADDRFITDPIKSEDWLKTLGNSSHCVCVHGGGYDLCPRVFEALWMGCTPIAKKHKPTMKALKMFPILWIDDWKDLLSLSNLSSQPLNLDTRFFTEKYWMDLMFS